MEKMDNFTYMSTQKIKYSIFIPNNKNAGSPCFAQVQGIWILGTTVQLNNISPYNMVYYYNGILTVTALSTHLAASSSGHKLLCK